MVGDQVQITTRRYDEALRDTKVLEFRAGLENRPLLRQANGPEMLHNSGTKVRVKLKVPPDQPNGLLWDEHLRSAIPLEKFALWLCPALDVDLFVRHKGSCKIVEKANDWRSLPATDFLKRISVSENIEDFERFASTIAPNLQDIRDNEGMLVGRIAIAPSMSFRGQPGTWWDFHGVVTAGGLRSSTLVDLAGILIGFSTRASLESV